MELPNVGRSRKKFENHVNLLLLLLLLGGWERVGSWILGERAGGILCAPLRCLLAVC